MKEKNNDDSEEDEDLDIDFSRIKNFFKGKKESREEKRIEKKEEVKEHHKKTEEKTEHKKHEGFKKIDFFDDVDEEDIEEKKIKHEKHVYEKKEEKKIKEIKKESEEDEEISIDFSRIKNWFKKLGEEEKEEYKPKKEIKKEHKKIEKEEAEEEISIDFSKIKNIFKAGKEKSKEKEHEEDEISVDWSKIGSFFSKYKLVFLLLIPIFFAIFLRMQTASLPFTDSWAQSSVYNGVQAQIRSQVDQQYPNLPDAQKQEIVNAQFQEVLKNEKQGIDNYIKSISEQFKDFFRDEKGRMYTPDIDPYYWMRYANNILDHGSPGDEIKDGVQWDNHMLAPNGRPAEISLHPYFLAYLYKILHIFSPDITINQSSSIYPVLIGALSIIPAFFIARRLAGNVGGFFAALMLAINSSFLTRTLYGHADTDTWNVFFPLYILWFFLEAFESNNIKMAAIFSALSGLFVGLFSFTWLGWWYIFDFILGAIGIIFLYFIYVYRHELKKGAIHFIKHPAIKGFLATSIIFIASSFIFTITIASFNISAFMSAFYGPFGFQIIKSPVYSTLWPNVLTTVAELNPGDMNSIVNSMGGRFLFIISIIGIILTMIKKDEHGKVDVKYAALLTLWFVGSIYASLKGIRFTIVLAPAFCISFGIALGIIYSTLNKYLVKEFHVNKIISGATIIILFFVLFIAPLKSSYAASRSDIPIVNDAWYTSLTMIKENSKPDAIINSWWDFGHHFKFLADRTVTFDGTSQEYPQAHWIGKTLLTDNEDLAVGILRMLDCGGNNAFDVLFEINNNTHKSVDILYDIVLLDKNAAKNKLIKNYGLTEKQAENVIQYNHCSPPEDFFIASGDMIGKAGVWAHFGSWDFERADIWYNVKNMEKEKAVDYMMKNFNYSREESENLYFEANSITSDQEANSWVAPWPNYASNINNCGPESSQNDTVLCDIGMRINLTTMDATINTQQGIMHPKTLVYAKKDGIYVKEFNNTIPYSVVLVPVGEKKYISILSDPAIASSMFTRLFFFEGHGLKHFKKFTEQTGFIGTKVVVYKIDWEGSEKNTMEFFKEKNITINRTQEKAEEKIIEEEKTLVEGKQTTLGITEETKNITNENSSSTADINQLIQQKLINKNSS